MDFNEIKYIYDTTPNENCLLFPLINSYKIFLYKDNCPNKATKKTKGEAIFNLHKFDRYLKAAYPALLDISEIKSIHIRNYIDFCKSGLNNSNITVNKKLRVIKQFLRFLNVYMHKLDANVAADVAYSDEIEYKYPREIPQSKLRILLSILYSYKYGVRDVSITKLLAYTGLKVGEIFNLDKNSIDLKNRKLKFKRDNDYISIALPNEVYSDLKEYMYIRSDLTSNHDDGKLFVSNTGRNYPVREYQNKFKLAVIDANFEEHFTPRNVRAMFLYKMARQIKKEDLKLISDQNKVSHYYEFKNLSSTPTIEEILKD